jgi:hypothetical protein
MIPVEYKYYNQNIIFVEKGWQKHFLCFDNCDSINGMIYFSLVMFNDAEITWDCDKNFWTEWLDFFCSSFGTDRNIKFTGDQVDIVHDKIVRKNSLPNLMYSGGKDSLLSKILLTDPHLMVFRAQHYQAVKCVAEVFTTNVDNEIYHSNKYFRGKLPLELLFPIINKYDNTYMGIEKEIWENPHNLINIDVKAYSELLAKYGLTLDSAIKGMYSEEVLRTLAVYERNYPKCGGNDFCYDDERCLTLFIMGCNKTMHDFDRDKYLDKHSKLKKHQDIHKTIDAIVSNSKHQHYFHELANKHWKGM